MAHASPHLASLVRAGSAWVRGTLLHGTHAATSSASGLASLASPAAGAAFRSAGSAAASSSIAAAPAGAAAGAATSPFLAQWRAEASAIATAIGARGPGTSFHSVLTGKTGQTGHAAWSRSLPTWQVGQDAARPSVRDFAGGAAEALGGQGGELWSPPSPEREEGWRGFFPRVAKLVHPSVQGVNIQHLPVALMMSLRLTALWTSGEIARCCKR